MIQVPVQKRPVWALCLFVSVIALAFMCPLAIGAKKSGRTPRVSADKAWAQIVPEINIFWKEREETPFAAKKTAWHIIAILKDFIVKYPESQHVPEAYYLTGIAYKEAGFIPEAISHWRIVAKEFSNSKWADEALMQILQVYDEQGEARKKRQLLKEIIRQYPDTTSAKAAWISLALESVIKGKNISFIEGEMKKLERADPNIASKVPVFLELKARLSLYKGRKKDAIEEWLHFLNLTTTKGKQALALYEIGEIYRSMGDFIRARKYYALCARDYPRTSYALFARFRLAQIHERELGIVPWAMNREKEEESSQWLYNEILKKFPRHPITQEVIYEFAKLKMRRHDLSGALRLIEFYFKTNPNGSRSHLFLTLSDEIQKRMRSKSESEKFLKKNLQACLELLKDSFLKDKLPGYSYTAKTLWMRLIEVKMNKGDFDGVIREANSLTQRFAHDNRLREFSHRVRKEALKKKFQLLIAQKNYMDLLNFFYNDLREFKDVLSWEHYLLVGRAWDSLGIESEAAFYYGRAFLSDGEGADNTTIIMDWARVLAAIKDADSLGRVLDKYDELDRGDHNKPVVYYHYRSLYGQMRGDWDMAYESATSGLEVAKTKGERRSLLVDLIRSSSHLRLWDVAHNAYRELEGYMNEEERVSFLDEWGDIAFELEDYEEAFFLYNMVLSMRPEARDIQLKMAIALIKQGKQDEAQGLLKALSVDKDEFYASYSEALLGNISFWKKIPKEFKAEVR